MLTDLLYVASKADYIRCDMAFLALNDQIQSIWGNNLNYWHYQRPSTEFWADAITTVKTKYPVVQFLAEVYDQQGTLQSLGFDFTYDKHLYDNLGNGNLDNIRSYISNLPASYIQRSAHFVENHDELRAAKFFGSNMRADGAAMVALTLPGMRFYNWGQREGFSNRLDVHLRRSYKEPVQTGVASFYDLFSGILTRDVFHTGTWSYKTILSSSTSWRLMAWEWSSAKEKALIVINYSDTIGAGLIIVNDASPVNGDNVTLTELISGEKYVRSNSEMKSSGLQVVVNYWSLQIFTYQ
jgi:glycosidase